MPERSINKSRDAFSKLPASTLKVKALRKEGPLPYNIPRICA